MENKNNKLYHVTTEENATKILIEGLKPLIGERSKAIHDERRGVFLCEKKDVAYWQIILGMPVILEVTGITFTDDQCYDYDYYNEIICGKEIPASNIKCTNMKPSKVRAMQRLCLSYIASISRFCELCARYYDENGHYSGDKELYEELDAQADTLLYVLPHLDFVACKKSRIITEIKYAGQELCAYTLCDKYYMENKRLYQKLIEYPEDSLTEKRKKIYHFVTTNLNGCLEVNTGGWCG